MIFNIKPKFKKNLKKTRDKKLLKGVEIILKNIESAKNVKEIKGILKLKGRKNQYRIKRKEIGNYRILLSHYEDTIILELISFLHRKDIYNVKV